MAADQDMVVEFTDERIATLRRYFGLAGTEEALADISATLQEVSSEVANEFYDHLLRFPELEERLRGKVEWLKKAQGDYFSKLVEGQIEDQMKAHGMGREEVIEKVILQRQPTREFATVEEIGGTAVFLCSDAAAQITGTTISIDGGWTAL